MLTVVLFLAAGDLLSDGQKAFQTGDFARAESLFRQQLKLTPASAETLSNLAAVLSRREQYDEAITLYRKALRVNPKLIPVHFNLGVAEMKAGRAADAAASFERFLKSYPNENRARILYGMCLAEAGDLKRAIPELERFPDDAAALYTLAVAHAREGDENRAVELLARLDPASAAATEGWVEYRRGRFAESRMKFEESLKLRPGQAPLIAALGRLALLENRDEEAIALLKDALARAPGDAESSYQLGVLHDRTGRSAEGRQYLERALTLKANYADPYYQLARIDFREKKYADALARLNKAVRILPNQEAIRLLLAQTYRALGRVAESDREFAEVRRLKQQSIERSRLKLDP